MKSYKTIFQNHILINNKNIKNKCIYKNKDFQIKKIKKMMMMK